MGISCHSFKFLWRRVNSKLPTIPFGIVACTFSDNLSWNSCISKRIDTCPLTETLRFLLAILKPRHVNIFHTLNHRANTADLSWRVYVVLRAQSRSDCARPVYQIQSCKSSCRWEVLWEKSGVIIPRSLYLPLICVPSISLRPSFMEFIRIWQISFVSFTNFHLILGFIFTCRRLIQFGMVTGIIRRLHKYPVQLTAPSKSTSLPRSYHRPRGKHSDSNRFKLSDKWVLLCT